MKGAYRLAVFLVMLAMACTKGGTQPPTAAEQIEVRGTITTIDVSDHPRGICDPQPSYTDVHIAFSANGSSDRTTTRVTPAEIVSTKPCTKVGAFTLSLDPTVPYEVCVESTSHDPDAIDIVGGGTCGIDVMPSMLTDARFDITFDSRKSGSKEYSSYS
jgi:hypothetical protein